MSELRPRRKRPKAHAACSYSECVSDLWGVAIAVLIVCVGALIVVPLGLRMYGDRRADRHLLERGVPADAKILRVEHEEHEGENRLALTLRFAGPGIAPFESTHRCGFADYSVGDHLAAVVDPLTNHFSVPTPR